MSRNTTNHHYAIHMIDKKQFREDPQFFLEAARAKGVELDTGHILELDREVRRLSSELEDIAAQKNTASDEIKSLEGDARAARIEEMRSLSEREGELKNELAPKKEELDELWYRIPNPALEDVSVSPNEDDNEVVKTHLEPTKFDFEAKDHIQLGEALGILDLESARKTSGARFTYLKGDGVRLQLALTQLAIQVAGKHGFSPVIVPHLVSAESMRAMGYLEHGGHDEIYYLPKDNQYLIGTSEQAIGPMHFNTHFKEEELPKRYIGMSPCYRREAGSYGKDTKGILRMHQFDKLELYSVTTPETSNDEHELILSIEEELMQALELPYQVIKMVTGDLGLPAARKYDIEAWIPSQETYRETHSCSTTTDFQSRRLNTKYTSEAGERKHVHMLNGTAFAIGRTMIALLENFQEEDGSVRIPDALQPFMGGQTHLRA